MSRVILNNVECQVLVCNNCGATFALPAIKYDACKDEGGFWFCPNGHQRGWAATASERAAKEREQQRIKQQNAQLQDEVAEKEREIAKRDRQVRKLKTRATHGICPCCNRSFPKLAMHMKSKHPDYNVVKLTAAKA